MHSIFYAKNVSKEFEKFKLENVSFEVQPGSIVGVIEKNGCGKSTLLATLMGITEVDSKDAKIEIDGTSLLSDEKAYKKKIAYVFNETPFKDGLSAISIGKYYGRYYDGYDQEKYVSLLEKYNLIEGPDKHSNALQSKKNKMKPKIEQLLPFGKEEKRKRYLTDLVLNLILLSIPLFINVIIMHGYKEKPEILAYPIYTAISFLSFFILIAHTSIGFGILKCSGLSRIKRNYENANPKIKVYEFFTYFFRIILAINLGLEGEQILFKSINLPTSALDAQLITYTTTFVSIGIVFLLFDMIRTLGGKNEY